MSALPSPQNASTFKTELVKQEADMHGKGGYIFPNAAHKVLLFLKCYGASSEKDIFNMSLYDIVYNKVDYKKMVEHGTVIELEGKYEITEKGLKEVNSIYTEVL